MHYIAIYSQSAFQSKLAYMYKLLYTQYAQDKLAFGNLRTLGIKLKTDLHHME